MRLLLPAPAQLVTRVGCALAVIGLAALTLVDRGATRMYAWPWWGIYWLMHGAVALALIGRALDSERALVLPGRAWLAALGATVAIVVAAALLSPFRGESVRAAATPLAAVGVFLLLFDWLHGEPVAPGRRPALAARVIGGALGVVIVASLCGWVADTFASWRTGATWATIAEARNPHPLGHTNYTAGLALLTLAWCGALAVRSRGPARAEWSTLAALALVALFTSGSRGGLLGLAAMAGFALFRSGLDWKRLAALGAAAGLGLAALVGANPRIRSLVTPHDPAAPPRASDVQRSAMLRAGWEMGRDRPLLGWGPGVTPWVYPRYRADLDGGAEDVLQLHSLPAQVWADAGALGLACLLGLLGLAAAAIGWRRRDGPADPAASAALLALCGYGVFALTDFQLDVPVFAAVIAACGASLAARAPTRATARARGGLAVAVIVATLAVIAFGRRDPCPALNARALALAREPKQADRAVALLRESLARNPDQEIAHFNLGWLLVVRDPAVAEAHFRAAACLVPDKGGVYFGLGLACLNRGDTAGAAHAWALECVNDPLFLTSPWWRVATVAAVRPAALHEAASLLRRAETRLPADRWAGREARYLAALCRWLAGAGDARTVADLAPTAECRQFFAAGPALFTFDGTVRAYRRERSGYPVLMKNLDVAPPVDLFDVQENPRMADTLRFLFPPKGWLPAPVLLELLAAPPTGAAPR